MRLTKSGLWISSGDIAAWHMLAALTALLGLAITQNPGFIVVAGAGIAVSLAWAASRTGFPGTGSLLGAILIAQATSSYLLNGVLTAETAASLLHLFLVAVLMPFARLPGNLRALQRVMVATGLALLGVALYTDATGPAAYRFGAPLATGVFGFYMTLAALSAIGLRFGWPLFLVFATACIASESRAAVGCLAIGWMILSGMSFVRIVVACVGLGLATLAVLYAEAAGWDVALLKGRDDHSSGRLLIWTIVLNKIGEAPLLGYGEAPVIFGVAVDRALTAHNSAVELAYKHGIPFAVMSYAFFGWLWWRARRGGRLVHALALALIARSMVTTTWWTNPVDAASLYVVYMLAFAGQERR